MKHLSARLLHSRR